MGKKKNKFKNRSHQTSNPAIAAIETSVLDEKQEPIEVKASAPTEVEKSEIDELNEKYQPIRRDVKKLLFVLAILAVLFIGAFFLNKYTDYLTIIGNWVYKIGHFQVQ